MSKLDSQSESQISPSILARKFRKKLRQIENLERLNRPLTEEECIKVNSKSSIREKLKDVLERLEKEPEKTPTSLHADAYLSEESIQKESPTTTDSFDFDPESNVAEGNEMTRNLSSESSPLTDTVIPARTGAGDKMTLSAATETHMTSQKQAVVKAQSEAHPIKEKKRDKVSVHLSKRLCQVTYLEGHSDIITSLVIVGETVITASRDTTLKSWDTASGEELHTFGGHTETVTCVTAIGAEYGSLIDSGFLSEDKLVISASFDCTLKMWSLNSGQLLKSVYTFNPLSKICFFPLVKQIVTGSDGGKLELWTISTGENCFSTLAYDASVTSIKVSGDMIYSSSTSGIIKVHQLREDGSLACLFVSEDIKTSDGRILRSRHVRCMDEIPGKGLLFGDDSRNLKLLDWRNGKVRKFPNHISDFSSTDALSCHDDYVITSSYDLDDGLGYINAWQLQSGGMTYQATLDDHETEKIMCLEFALRPKGNLLIVSGGVDLKMWDIFLPGGSQSCAENEQRIICLEFRQALSVAATDSESESEEDSGTEDEEDGENQGLEDASNRDSEKSTGQWGVLSWCSVL